MTRRRYVMSATVLALLTCAIAGALIYRPEPEVVRAYYRLELGMTRADIEDIIGCPSADLTDVATTNTVLRCGGFYLARNYVHETGPSFWTLPPTAVWDTWVLDDHMIEVVFDSTGRVIRLALLEPMTPTLFERARAWLGL